jgi:urea transporter
LVGCSITVSVGCIEDDIDGGVIGYNGGIVSALWACRSKY